MDIIISTLERAVADAVALLTRSRYYRSAPLYLRNVTRPLKVTVTERAFGHARVEVTCESWGSTTVTLTLSEADENWLPWGAFTIGYGADYPVATLADKRVTKDIYPMYANRPDAVRHLELRIRSRAR